MTYCSSQRGRLVSPSDGSDNDDVVPWLVPLRRVSLVFAPPAWEKEGALRGRHKSAEMSPPPLSNSSHTPPIRDHRLARASILQLAIKYLPCSRVSLSMSKTSKSHSVWQCAADVTAPSLQQNGPAVSCDVCWRSQPVVCARDVAALQPVPVPSSPGRCHSRATEPSHMGRAGHKTDTGRHSLAQRNRLIGRVSSPVPLSLSLCLVVGGEKNQEKR